ncbi:MAG: thiol peroxidase [Candidatus Omnitrophica bacterium]|nr:thiol peroxidase [Candidatus Omnitrophota bacterium]MCM8809294.1 thiol peroxidase [Candidatus Omnitrophota bacterium]MCM8810785.1 thiol peroxidase [Candidatus Omnitrophota bacterium]
MERIGLVTLKGKPITLIGIPVSVGDKSPDFTVIDSDLNEVKLSDFKGKIKVISVTPSLDTPVCDLQAKKFNEKAVNLPEKIVIINISMDLPFAISRFCSIASIDKIKVYSDHKYASFGISYGLLIKELRLLTRSIIVVDSDDIIRYIEIVPEITNHPNYDKAIEVAISLYKEQDTE